MRRGIGRALIIAALGWAASSPSAAVDFTTIVTGLSAPVAMVDPPDGLRHRFIAQQGGDVLVWDGTSDTPLAVPFLDLRDDPSVPVAQRKVLAGGERGLLAMTVHPNYAQNGLFYLYYTSRDWDGAGGINAGDVVIERYQRDPADPNVALPGSGAIILVVPHSSAGNHNGGDIKFGPDGFLYVTIGDGGGSCDNVGHSGQDTNQLLGKMLRLDVNSDSFPADPLHNYAIPAGNPLVGVAGADEIWALGLRNPFRFSFDRQTGDIYIGDVGQDDWEEIDRLTPGAVTAGAPVNFGWPCLEGFVDSECAAPPQGCGATFTPPVRVEPNAGAGGTWQAIIAGAFYRGGRVSELVNRFVYGDALNGQVWAATPAAAPPPGWPSAQLTTGSNPHAFAQDQLNELYVLFAGSGEVKCLHAAGDDCMGWAVVGDIFADGFESGDFAAWSFHKP